MAKTVRGAGANTSVNVIAIVHVEATAVGVNRAFASTRCGDPIKFTVGAGHIAEAIDVAVATICEGERVIVTCSPRLALGFVGCFPCVRAAGLTLYISGWSPTELPRRL